MNLGIRLVAVAAVAVVVIGLEWKLVAAAVSASGGGDT
jgi:hypothetical protein